MGTLNGSVETVGDPVGVAGIADAAGGRRVVRGACPHDCPDTCAMLVTVEDGRVTGVRGDPDHPFTAGALCPKVHDYERRVHHPDRVLYPLRRVGAKGEGRFERISWERALDEIAERFGQISREYGAEAILPYSYLGTQGLLNGLSVGDPFFHRLGASVSERTFCASGSSTAYLMTVGPTAGLDPESLVHARCIVLWGANVKATNIHAWKFVARAQSRGAQVVAIDPLRTRTARGADWHIPLRPGTDAALALGVANVIIAEGLADDDYVERYTAGFDEFAERAREYPPERVETITGVPADDVRRLARLLANAQPSAIRVGVAVERSAGGGQAIRAITCLPALVGAWRHVGGGILALTHWAFPVNLAALSRPDWIRPGTRVVNQWQLGAALTGELALEPPIKALFVYNSNPAVVVADQQNVLRGLARDDLFCVVGEQFITDTARYADIVLPNTTQAEQLDLMHSWGQLYVTLNQPAIEPLGEAVPNREMFARLAARMGFDDPQFSISDEQAIRELALDWSHPCLAGITFDTLRETGWARLTLPDPDHYAPHAEGGFPTPSGRCELYSSVAEQEGDQVMPFFREGYDAGQSRHPLDPLPHHVQANGGSASERPLLTLVSPKAQAFLNSSYGNMRRQLELMGGAQQLIINPLDAAERAIEDGQTVWVRNDRGRIEVRAQVSDAVMRGVVVVPMGYWQSGTSATVNATNPTELADFGGAPTFSDNRVEVTPVLAQMPSR